jgi:thymidine phosphorylase
MISLPIILSSGVVSTVKSGDSVKVGQVIATREAYREYPINLASELSTSLEKARKYLVMNPGDKVEIGDVLAKKRGLFGFREVRVVSNVGGDIARYERNTGNLVIRSEADESAADIVSPVDGIVTMCDNDKIVLATEKDIFNGRKAAGENILGEVYIIDEAFSKNDNTDRNSEILMYYSLDNRAVGKIVVGRSFSRDLLIKGIGIGVAGIIGTEIRDEDIEYLSKRNMQIPIIEVDNDIIEKARQWKGKRFYLNTQEKVILFLHT